MVVKANHSPEYLLAIPCIYCGAEVGERCIIRSRSFAAFCHMARYNEYQKKFDNVRTVSIQVLKQPEFRVNDTYCHIADSNIIYEITAIGELNVLMLQIYDRAFNTDLRDHKVEQKVSFEALKTRYRKTGKYP